MTSKRPTADSPDDDAESEPAAPGRHWLKYAGIGGERRSSTKPAKQEITSLGSLEAELLGILWDIGKPATSMEIMETTLYKRRARNEDPPAFATIATTLRRLTSKGLLETHKHETRTPVYWPTVEREQMAARILNNVSVTLLGSSLHGLLPRLIGQAKNSRAGEATRQSDKDLRQSDKDLHRLMQALEQVANASEAERNKDLEDSHEDPED